MNYKYILRLLVIAIFGSSSETIFNHFIKEFFIFMLLWYLYFNIQYSLLTQIKFTSNLHAKMRFDTTV